MRNVLKTGELGTKEGLEFTGKWGECRGVVEGKARKAGWGKFMESEIGIHST